MKESFSRLRQLEHHINETVRLYDNIQTDDYPAHWNNSFEVIMPVVNEYTVYVSDIAYVVKPDEVLIIPAGSVHEIYAPEKGRRYIFMIDQSQFYAVEGLAAVQHVMQQSLENQARARLEALIALDGTGVFALPHGLTPADILAVHTGTEVIAVNLSGAFCEAMKALSPDQERACVYAMVNTLTQGREASRVQFFFEGEQVSSLTGELEMRGAFVRNPGMVVN